MTWSKRHALCGLVYIHLNYWAMGYPAIIVTDTSFYRNKAYHTKADTAERLNYQKMAQLVNATYQTLLDQAQTPN